MKKIYFISLFFAIIIPFVANAQYFETHNIPPSPWQYWSQANEIVVSTLDPNPVTVTLSKSDGTFITTLTVVASNPLSYRFLGSPSAVQRNLLNQVYDDRGLIIKATAPVLVNYRNIASDVTGATSATIKGNASLLSFGDEGEGTEFRVGYYRANYSGLSDGIVGNGGSPVYSVMALEDITKVSIPSGVITLNKGQSYLFYAPLGTLITANKNVVMNAGSYGDTPQACNGNGEDGTVDQLAPVNSLGTKYMIVRGAGAVGIGPAHPEQSLIIASEDNTKVIIDNYSRNGVSLNTQSTIILANAGDFYNFHHGDAVNQYSSSLVVSDKPVSLISGTAYGCETDFSTVLPIGGCTGSTDIRTRKFINYNNVDLNFFSYIIIESATEPVYLNGSDVEILTGNPRVQIGNTSFYLITFNNFNIGLLDANGNILINSLLPLTVSIVQQEANVSSMSAFFSSFGESTEAPFIASTNPDCTITLEATDGYFQYDWFINGVLLETTTQNKIIISQSGNYSVKVLKNCGWTRTSKNTPIDVEPCNDLSLTKEVDSENGAQAIFKITVTNNSTFFGDPNVNVLDLLPSGYTFVSYVSTQGTYDNTTGIWTIGFLDKLQTAEILITVNINSDGFFENIATVTGQNPDPNLENNTDFDEIQRKLADLDATKTDGFDYYLPRQELNYIITIINKGPAVSYNVKVSDPMPFGVTNMSWTSSINTSGEGDLIDLIPRLDVNSTVVYNVKLNVPNNQTGDFINIVEVTSDYTLDPVETCTACIDIDRQWIVIPKGISPNGDGINDFLNLENFHVTKISIYNRFGTEVYSKHNYLNEWKGQSKSGKSLPTGTYFYVIDVLNGDRFTGYIYLNKEIK